VAALASVTLFSESADAAPAKPSITEVKKQVDQLNQQAELASQQYLQAKEKTDQQRTKVNQLLAQVAQKTQKMNETRDILGQFASAQYRDGGLDQTTQLLLSNDPEAFLQQTHLMDRLSTTQEQALSTFKVQQEQASVQRAQATKSLSQLTAAQTKLATQKKNATTKLATAQKLLNSLTAQQRAAVAAMDKGTTTVSKTTSAATSVSTGSASSRGAAAIAFAEQQLGKPYVYGATGPGSYDCSGLTQAAWRAAGVTLPRVTYDQVTAGTTVSLSEAQPGDLVFFYGDVSHVGLYVGNGMMIHAPKPGAYVREESIFYDGESAIHSVVRPA